MISLSNNSKKNLHKMGKLRMIKHRKQISNRKVWMLIRKLPKIQIVNKIRRMNSNSSLWIPNKIKAKSQNKNSSTE